ncbi:MAG: homocysteine S-methyltransferase [Ilumatobacteraceae bacterium]|nr:homocysteine S-methyltransferase [Ilumatobacteraceae bacterium]
MRVDVEILDGGLSTALEEVGADIGGPLWTARTVVDSPGLLEEAHRRFVTAGARVITSASYQCGTHEFARLGLSESEARRALSSTIDVARRATAGTDVRVAASVGPFGAVLADGSEYTGRYDVSREIVERYHREKLEVLVDSGADLLAVETIPLAAEACVIAEILEDLGAPPAWFSFGLASARSTYGGDDPRSAVAGIAGYANLVAVGVNCVHPAVVDAMIDDLGDLAPDAGLIAYPNLGRLWDAGTREWSGDVTDPFAIERIAEWIRRGVTMIGGCCGVGPSDIARLVAVVKPPVA